MVTRGRVVVVGSANEDIVVRAVRLPVEGETVVGSSLTRGCGGKSANQAVAAARAGAATHFVGCVGDDPAGLAQLDALAADGVDVAGVVVDATAVTGTALVTVDDRGRNQIVVVPGANARLEAGHVTATLGALRLGRADVVLVGFEVSDPVVLAAAAAARSRGATVIVNPAPARPLPATLLDLHPILVPNRSELATLVTIDDVESAARALAGSAAAPVVVTLGERGALVVEDGRAHAVPSDEVRVVDTTGAGDTFAGILAARLAAGDSLLAAARVAVVGAARSVTGPGARSAMPTWAEPAP